MGPVLENSCASSAAVESLLHACLPVLPKYREPGSGSGPPASVTPTPLVLLPHDRGRGTISAADIVTDAIVYPEPLDSWLPEDIKQVGCRE